MNGEEDSPEELWLRDFTFLPSIDIRQLNPSTDISTYDILKSDDQHTGV